MEAPVLFDSHAHYNDRRFEEEFEGGGRGALLKAHEEGVAFFCNVGSSVRTSEESVRLAEEFDFVVAAAGIHPSDAQEIPTYSEMMPVAKVPSAHPPKNRPV